MEGHNYKTNEETRSIRHSKVMAIFTCHASTQMGNINKTYNLGKATLGKMLHQPRHQNNLKNPRKLFITTV
jgi:hypothetical protein